VVTTLVQHYYLRNICTTFNCWFNWTTNHYLL